LVGTKENIICGKLKKGTLFLHLFENYAFAKMREISGI